MKIKFIPIEPHEYNRGVGDKRKQSAYRVEADGVIIGEVHSLSDAIWRHSSSGKVRTTLRGYARYWEAVFPDGSTNNSNWTRQQAVETLIRKGK